MKEASFEDSFRTRARSRRWLSVKRTIGLLVWMPLKRSKRLPERVPVMLVRWDYIATMTFHLRREEQAAREPIGFSPV